MLSSPRRPDTTIRIFSSAVYCLRVLRRISRTVLSAGSFLLIDFCLIFVPFGHYDEPEILRYAITSICPKGADVRHTGEAEVAIDSVDGRCNRACPCDVGDQAVNVRAGPGTSYAKVGLLEIGDGVQVVEAIGDWFKLATQPGRPERFIYAPLLSGTAPTAGIE